VSRRAPIVVLALAGLLLTGMQCGADEPTTGGAAVRATAKPDDYGEVADFTFTDASGAAFGRADLLGKVWVAGFIFTRCAGPCPTITTTMVRLQEELFADGVGRGRLRLVAFSVDPAHDDPEVLTRYGETFGVAPDRSHLLTGDGEAIEKLVLEGFHLGMARSDDPAVDPGLSVTHSTRLCVVGPDGHIKGYYEVNDPASLHLLRRRVRKLLGD